MDKEYIQHKIEDIAQSGASDGCNMAYVEREAKKLANEIAESFTINLNAFAKYLLDRSYIRGLYFSETLVKEFENNKS